MNRRHFLLFSGLSASLAITGCAGPALSDFAGQTPALELDRYFNGKITAYGLVQKRGGAVARRFTVIINASWEGANGTLDEQFTYADGETQRRIWHLTKHADGRYTGTADDVVGVAQGQTSGNAFHWTYTLKLPINDSIYDVQFDDWMFLIDERVMLNRATMSKFGITLGEVFISFVKH